jgi:hypothetical protein
VVTYPANRKSLSCTLESIQESDWGEEAIVISQPQDWPLNRESGSRNFKRAMETALTDGCDYAVILEDDVRVNKYLRHNLSTLPLVQRDQCDYLSLFIPDLIANPWLREEAHLGYRLARPRYLGPHDLWQRKRIWGAQGYLLSKRLMRAAIRSWDHLVEGQDTRMMSVCHNLEVPLWYSMPCLVEHVPWQSVFGTPIAYAPDFDPDFRLEIQAGFQPPEDVPGCLTIPEAKLLWKMAMDQEVLELGTAAGRATVSLAQSAKRVLSVDRADQSEAREWARRYGLSERIEFHRGEIAEVRGSLTGPFGMVFIDTEKDTASVERNISLVLPHLKPDAILAFHDYPDPRSPDVRRVVDEHARRLGWKRLAQADFLGVFRA